MVKDQPNQEDLSDLISIADDSGYDSMLFVFQENKPENMILVANALKKNQNIKLMFALRPHAITPMYCSNLISAYNIIAPNRMVFNIVAGTYDSEAIYFNAHDNIVDRKIYAGEFVKKVRDISGKLMPKIVFSGRSIETITNVNEHGDCILLKLNDYLENKDMYSQVKKDVMVRAWIGLGDTDSDAYKKVITADQDYIEFDATIIGTQDSVIEQIHKLEALGITDILISNVIETTSQNDVHNLVKKYIDKYSDK